MLYNLRNCTMDLLNNNIIPAILAVLPTAIFAWLAIKFSKTFVDVKTSFMHVILGVAAFTLVTPVYFTFPYWNQQMFPDSEVLSDFFGMMVQVALLEELLKLGSYKLAGNTHRVGPMQSMMYMLMVGCGFAVLENFQYIGNYGWSAIVPRIGSVTVHMTCALIMGYFMNIGRVAVFGKIVRKIMPLVGILLAVFYHGIFDFNIKMGGDTVMLRVLLILAIGISAGCFAIEDLRRRIR